MIALFKRPARRELVPADVPALVKQIDAMEAEAHRMLIGAYVTQIHELARAAEKELAFGRQQVEEIPAASGDDENLGEGYWEVELAEVSAKHVGRYAREARHWLQHYNQAVQRLEAGQGFFPWVTADRHEHPLALERCNMEAAQ